MCQKTNSPKNSGKACWRLRTARLHDPCVKLKKSSFSQSLRALSASQTNAWCGIDTSEFARLSQSLNQISSALRTSLQSPEITKLVELIGQFKRFEESAEVKLFRQQLSEIQIAARSFVLPSFDLIPSMAAELSRVVEPLRSIALEEDWQAKLTRTMSQLNQPWAIEAGVGLSAVGFARLVRLSDAAHSALAIFEPVTALFNNELGAEHEDVETAPDARILHRSRLDCKPI